MTKYQVKAGLENFEEFTVCGVSVITSNETAAEDINALWERFFKESVGQYVANKVDDIIYAVYSDYEGDHTKPYRLTIGYKVQSDNILHNASPGEEQTEELSRHIPAAGKVAEKAETGENTEEDRFRDEKVSSNTTATSTPPANAATTHPRTDLHYVNCIKRDYAVLSAQGPQPQSLIETWTAIWESDLNRSLQTDYEIYGPRFFEDGVNEVLVCIGVKS